MTNTTRMVKDPDAVLDYQIDWSSWLATGETISSSDWVVQTGITENSASNTTTTATIWLSGGAAGVTYTVTNRIVTTASRTNDRSLYITVREQ